jgi:hypothetical protein
VGVHSLEFSHRARLFNAEQPSNGNHLFPWKEPKEWGSPLHFRLSLDRIFDAGSRARILLGPVPTLLAQQSAGTAGPREERLWENDLGKATGIAVLVNHLASPIKDTLDLSARMPEPFHSLDQ